ncbi:MAG: polymer-forming cytoskeletal protein [Alphaproteobacteria bacterium]
MSSASDPSIPSIISANLQIAGDLISNGDLQIDGIIEGNVRSQTLTVGETASITGDVEAESVQVRGTVTGQINARTVTLTKTARVIGDVMHETLAIDAGAYLEGACRHVEAARPAVETIGVSSVSIEPAKDPEAEAEAVYTR